MNLKVNQDKCIGCGSCVSLTDSKVFDFNDDGKAEVIANEIEKDDEEVIEQAIEYCPTSAISKD